MSSVDSRMVQPMLIGGVAMGVTSSIPGLSCLNLCCCLLGLAGGALAAFLYFKDSAIPEPAPYGPAALLGAGAGAIGGVIVTVLGTIIQMAMGGMQDMSAVFEQMDLPPEAQQFIDQAMAGGGMGAGMLAVSFFMNLFLYAIFGALGAILLVSFMQKKGGGGTPGGGAYGPSHGQGPVHGQGSFQGNPPAAPPAGGTPPPPSAPPSNLPPPPQ